MAAALGAALLIAPQARAQCTPELDAQSGVSGTPFVVSCVGAETDQQGDGTNDFIDITVDGSITRGAGETAIYIRNDNVVTVNGTIGAFIGLHLRSASDLVNNSFTLSNTGSFLASPFNIVVEGFAGGSGVRNNTFSIAGALDSTQTSITFDAEDGAISGNEITLAGSGSIDSASHAIHFFDGASIDTNTITIDGAITSLFGTGVYFDYYSSLTGTTADNIIDVNGSIESTFNRGIFLRSGSGGVLRNEISVDGTIEARVAPAIQIRAGAVGYDGDAEDNTITVGSAGSVESLFEHAIVIEGYSADGNTVTVNGDVTGSADPSNLYNYYDAVRINALGGSATNNVVTIGATGAARANAAGVHILAYDFVADNTVTVNGTIETINSPALNYYADGVFLFGSLANDSNVIDVNGVIDVESHGVFLASFFENSLNEITVGGSARISTQSNDAILLLSLFEAHFNEITVDAGGVISSPYSAGVAIEVNNYGDYGILGNTITINGAIEAQGDGVRLFSGRGVYDNDITIGASSKLTIGYGHGIHLYADYEASGNTILVAGTIDGDDNPYGYYTGGVEIEGAGVINNVITVSGSITTRDNAISLAGAAVNGNTIDNSGVINGLAGSAIEFTGPGAGNALTNRASGDILGDINTATTTGFDLSNYGDIAGDIFFGGAGELFLYAGMNLNGAASGAGDALAYLRGPGSDSLALGGFSGFFHLNVESGAWSATGVGAGFGATTIANGALLNLNGSLPGPVGVAAGGTLTGNGSTGPLTIGGAIGPGNSVGTINVAGPVSFSASSLFDLEVEQVAGVLGADQVIATGAATINGGTVATTLLTPLTLAPGVYSLPIVTASSVGGTFSSFSFPSTTFTTGSLAYTPTQVLLRITQASFCSVAAGSNQNAVCGALDALGPAADAYNELLALPNAAAAQAAFESLSGAGHGSGFLVWTYLHDLFTRFAFDRLTAPAGFIGAAGLVEERVFAAADDGARTDASYAESDSELRMWARAFGAYGAIEAVPSVAETDFQAGGLALGLERRMDGKTIGLGLGFSSADADVGLHDFDIEAVQFQLYGGGDIGRIEFMGVAGADRYSVNSARTIVVGPASDVAHANFDGWILGAAAEAGYRLTDGAWRAAPFVGLHYRRVGHEGFTESGSSLGNLAVEDNAIDALRASAGIRLQAGDHGMSQRRFYPALRVAYAREIFDAEDFVPAFASSPGTAFRIEGAQLGRDRLLVGFGAAVQLSPRAQVGLAYDGEISADDQEHSATARLRVDL